MVNNVPPPRVVILAPANAMPIMALALLLPLQRAAATHVMVVVTRSKLPITSLLLWTLCLHYNNR